MSLKDFAVRPLGTSDSVIRLEVASTPTCAGRSLFLLPIPQTLITEPLRRASPSGFWLVT